jgi:glycosyltransferase involved in cell wall biosynthesis
MRACFFARVRDPALFEIVDFYRNDIEILRQLGFEVVLARTFSEVPWDCDLYFTWWWGPGMMSLAKSLPRGRPNVFTGALQLGPEVQWWQSLGPVKRVVVRSCLHLATANLAISRAELAHLSSLGAPRAQYVPLGIDTELYRPGSGESKGKTVVTVSHLTADNVRRKRLMTVVRAVPLVLAEHSDARFVVVGARESGYQSLVDLARSLGVADAIEFVGRISTEEKIRIYQQASLLAQSTIYEGFGVAQAEAMSCGLPVVTSARGSVPEVVGDCGRYVEPDDAEGMARAIVELLNGPEAAAALGAAGRARIMREYSLSRRRDALSVVFASVM